LFNLTSEKPIEAACMIILLAVMAQLLHRPEARGAVEELELLLHRQREWEQADGEQHAKAIGWCVVSQLAHLTGMDVEGTSLSQRSRPREFGRGIVLFRD
jgi:hypothetical protein